MKWPFSAWGADLVLAGHDHLYERLLPPGETAYYTVNGMGGASLRVRKLRQLDLLSPTGPGRPHFLSAASGLVRSGRELYVVGDDELQLGCFSATGSKPGTLLRLFKGNLPLRPKARKKRKAREAAVRLHEPHG